MRVNEIFHSIQGEGKTIGQPRLFIRFQGCQARCRYCDTSFSQNSRSYVKGSNLKASMHQYTKPINQLKDDIKNLEGLSYNRWVITGGEPLLQQDEIIKLIKDEKPEWVEIETNGIIEPKKELIKLVNLWNISPKNEKYQKYKIDTTPKIFNSLKLLKDYVIKIVYTGKEDENFIFQFKKIPKEKIYIMPEGKTREEQFRKSPDIIKFCLKNNFNFSPRLHVLVWNRKRAV